MRILYVTTGLDYGGAEVQVRDLALRFALRGNAVRMVSLLPPVAFVEELINAGIRVDSLEMRRGIPDPRAVWRLAAVIREFGPDVVHSHQVHANFLARATRILAPVPRLVCTAHSTNEGPRWRELCYGLTEGLCDLTTNVSPAAVQRYIAVGAASPERIRFVPNGIDLERFRPDLAAREQVRERLGLPSSSFAWLCVARFDPAKAHSILIEAFANVSRAFPGTWLILVGQGPCLDAAKRQVEAAGLSARVLFLGVRKEVAPLMNAADGFVLSSMWEGLPITLLEAGASALPCVATSVGGNAEVVVHGRGGLLAPPGDALALSSEMMKFMRLSVEERLKFGQSIRAHVIARYGFEGVLAQWERVYEGA